MDVVVGEMCGMHRTHVWSEESCLGEHTRGRLAGGRDARSILCWLLGHMEVHDAAVTVGDDGLEVFRVDCAHAVRCKPDRPSVPAIAEEVDSIEPRIHRAIGESALFGERLGLVETGVQVCDVEEGEFESRRACRIDHCPTHFVGVCVVAAFYGVMDVVELSDPGDARKCHLGEHRGRECPIVVRRQSIGDRIHRLPPRPEVARTPVGVSAQRAMKSMAVGVHETWHHHATDDHISPFSRSIDLESGDFRTFDGDSDVFVCRLPTTPHPLRVIGRHDQLSHIGKRTPRCAAVSIAWS